VQDLPMFLRFLSKAGAKLQQNFETTKFLTLKIAYLHPKQ